MIFGKFIVLETHCVEEKEIPQHSYGPCDEEEAQELIMRHKQEVADGLRAASCNWMVLPLEEIDN